MKAGAERRIAAPHPGPMLARDYLEPLGLDAASFAAALEMDPSRLGAMLDGRASIDVDAAVRIARCLQLPAERIMQMQLRSDFASARAVPALERVTLLQPPATATFPALSIAGNLGRSSGGTGDEDSLFFRERLEKRVTGDDYAGLHALWRGDRLRVYDAAGAVTWNGPILQDFDGRVLLPYVRHAVWHEWFARSLAADLALGPEHEAYLRRAAGASAVV